MSENRNTKIMEKNQKVVRKMKKYIRTFPLKSEEINLIHRDIDGMAEEARERGESLEQVLGKNPREFCDELMYAVGGIKTPGGRKILRFVGGWYKFLAFMFLLGALMSLASMVVYIIGDLFSAKPDILGEIQFAMPDSIEAIILGAIYYIAGKHAIQYSTDVSLANKAMKWGVGMFLFEVLSYVVLSLPDIGKTSVALWIFWLVCDCFGSVLFIIGAWRNRPHLEGETV